MSKPILTAIMTAGAIALSGAAFAQTGTMSSGNKGMSEESMTKTAEPSKALIGQDVVNLKGDTIGEVDAIDGNSLIVGVGGFLGIGERKVAIGWDQVSLRGSGKDTKLQVNMSKAQLEALPEYKPKSMSK